MTETRKLLDDAPDEVTASLLRSAIDDQPSARAFSRTAVALGVSGLVPLATTAASAASATGTVASGGAKVVGLFGLKWFGLGALAGLVLAGGASVALRDESTPSANTAPPATEVSAAVNAPVVKPEAAPSVVPPAPTGEAPGQPSARRDPVVQNPKTETEQPAVAKTPTIAREIAVLDGARAALRRNDPGAALAAVDGLERDGAVALGPEVTVIRVQALLARGETAKATALARRFLAENPSTPHANRMREIIRSHQ